jgi:hypothetical protein
MRRLLLHTCCAPCLSGAHEALLEDGLDITSYFYNPNIHPEEEFKRRIECLKKYSEIKKISTVIVADYGIELFEKSISRNSGDRCINCYELRLEAAAIYASVNNFDCYSTTLLISPYQKHDIIKKIGEELAGKYNINFFYKDLRPYYKESVSISKLMGLYRQKYCGCYLSEGEKNGQNIIAAR